MAYGDGKVLQGIFGIKPKPKKVRKPSHRFMIGMNVIYCGCEAKIVGKEGRIWQVECEGEIWPSKGKDMKPA